jgi:hypothetical protein
MADAGNRQFTPATRWRWMAAIICSVRGGGRAVKSWDDQLFSIRGTA